MQPHTWTLLAAAGTLRLGIICCRSPHPCKTREAAHICHHSSYLPARCSCFTLYGTALTSANEGEVVSHKSPASTSDLEWLTAICCGCNHRFDCESKMLCLISCTGPSPWAQMMSEGCLCQCWRCFRDVGASAWAWEHWAWRRQGCYPLNICASSFSSHTPWRILHHQTQRQTNCTIKATPTDISPNETQRCRPALEQFWNFVSSTVKVINMLTFDVLKMLWWCTLCWFTHTLTGIQTLHNGHAPSTWWLRSLCWPDMS